MESIWRNLIWRQFGAAIDMLENSIRACPDDLWRARLWDDPEHSEWGDAWHPEWAEFWYIAYHTLFWLDYYLSEDPETFSTPTPISQREPEMDSVLPERVYSRGELLAYLQYGREKCRTRIASADLLASQRCRPNTPDMTVAELLLYTMRHVEEHNAQLSMLLGQKTGSALEWVGRTKSKL
jgi:uncharacterized damage-inducible protein DinB